jgi:hypothetical protein
MVLKRGRLSRDFLIGCGTMVLAGAALWDLARTPPRRFGMAVLSSTDYPTAVAWVLLAFGALLGLTSLWGSSNFSGAVPPRRVSTEKRSIRRSLPVLLATLVFVVSIPVMGFYVSTVIFLGFLVYTALEIPSTAVRLSIALAVATGTAGVVYLIFDVWLNYFLPRGRLW